MSSESESNVEITRSTFLSCERMLSLSIEFSCFNSFLLQVSRSNSTHVHLKYVDLDSEGRYSIVLTVTQDCISNSISISIFMNFSHGTISLTSQVSSHVKSPQRVLRIKVFEQRRSCKSMVSVSFLCIL